MLALFFQTEGMLLISTAPPMPAPYKLPAVPLMTSID